MNESRTRAQRTDWETTPMPTRRQRLKFERTFSRKNYAKMRQGLIPQVMEDRWFIYMENDRWYFHYSWMGHCIYEMQLRRKSDAWQISETIVNRDPSEYVEICTPPPTPPSPPSE